MTERSPRYRVAVLLGHDQDSEVWRRRHAAGEVADPTPYGYDVAADEFEMRWSRSHLESPPVRRIRDRVAATLNFDLVHVWRNRRLIRWADVVWTHTEREHLAVAAVQVWRPRARRTPVLAQSVWLWDRWSRWGRVRRALVSRLLRTHPVECTHSLVNGAFSLAEVPGRRVLVVPFGTSVSSVSPRDSNAQETDASRALVLALGNDADRDWNLLLDVATAMPEVDFRVASSRRSVRAMPWPNNATCAPATSRTAVADLYREAAVVAVPLKINRHASGATTCIEATGSGVAVVATHTGGIEDYLPPTSHLVEVGDVGGWVTALHEVLSTPPTSDPEFVVRQGLTQHDYVARYVALTRDLLGLEAADRRVSQFQSMAGFGLQRGAE